MITLLEDARAMLAEKEGGGPIRARVLARLAAALRDQPDRGARDQQHRGRPPWTLKTEISRTAIPIAASMALELSGHVAPLAGGDCAYEPGRRPA